MPSEGDPFGSAMPLNVHLKVTGQAAAIKQAAAVGETMAQAMGASGKAAGAASAAASASNAAHAGGGHGAGLHGLDRSLRALGHFFILHAIERAFEAAIHASKKHNEFDRLLQHTAKNVMIAIRPIGDALIAIFTPIVKLIDRLARAFNSLPEPLRRIAGYVAVFTAFGIALAIIVQISKELNIALRLQAFWMGIIALLQSGWKTFLTIVKALTTAEGFYNMVLAVTAMIKAAIAAFDGNWAGLAVGLGLLAAAGIAAFGAAGAFSGKKNSSGRDAPRRSSWENVFHRRFGEAMGG